MPERDLLLHPVRWRIVQALLPDRRLTTAGVARELPDVAPATLYRQLATLLDGGVLQVTGEQRIRGAVERTYALNAGQLSIDPQELAALSRQEQRRTFGAFVARLLADFERYLDTAPPGAPSGTDLEADRAGFRQHVVWVGDDEADDMLEAVREALRPFLSHDDDGRRRRRILATITFPTSAGAAVNGDGRTDEEAG